MPPLTPLWRRPCNWGREPDGEKAQGTIKILLKSSKLSDSTPILAIIRGGGASKRDIKLHPCLAVPVLFPKNRGLGTSAKLEGQERFSAHFFPCNDIGLLFNFVKVGGAAVPSAPAVPGHRRRRIV